MKKIICIGECSLNIILGADGVPQGSMPGGRIVNAAAILARAGLPVVMASEAAADSVGQIVVDFLSRAGADVAYFDRFTEGRTPLNVFTAGREGILRLNRYEQYPPQDGFDIVWPRVDEGDIVVFGGYYAIDARVRPRLTKFLDHASEMKAVLVYLPGFLPEQEPRITRVMPALLENLELADIVITRNDDLRLIFGVDEDAACYRNHIGFYCRSLVNVDAACRRISYFGGKEMTSAEIPGEVCGSLIWNAGALAGVVEALVAADAGREILDEPPAGVREDILRHAVEAASDAAASLSAPWQQCP
jgi:fructokinase